MKKIYFCLFVICSLLTQAQMTVTTNSIATSLAQTITGFGVTVSNAVLSCTSKGAGTFTYTGTHLGLTNGVILTTGNATTAAQPQASFSSTDNGNNVSDPQLTNLEPMATHNLCRLEFDFVPICPSLSIKYVFASEEYPAYVGAGYNDAFGIFLTGTNPAGGSYSSQNIARLPNGQNVSIDNVNSSSNSSSFVANYNLNYTDIVYGGFTVPITSTASVTPCQTYHIKFAIADAGDGAFDSGVFIQNAGLSCSTSPTVTPSSTASACGGSTGTASVAVTGVTPASYSWQPGGQTTAGITGQSPGTYTCIMTFTSACSSYTQSQAVNIPASAGTGTVAVTSNAPCAGSTLTLSTISGGTSYTWTGPGGFVSTASSPTISPASAANSGVYSVTVVSSGCASTGTVNATVNPNPTVTMPGTQTLTCASPSVSLVGSATPSTCTPVWTGGVCNGANSYTATACSGGTYTLTVTNPATGCSGSGTVSVVSGAGAVSATASNSGPLTCTTTSVQVVATTTSTPVTYTWTGPGTVTGAATSTGTVSTGGNYTCVITNTSTGCSTTITTNVATNTVQPAPSITAPATITCAAPTITLTGSPASGVTYTWTGSGITSGSNTATPSVNQPGVYTLSVTSTTNGCMSFTNVTVSSNAVLPVISLSPNTLTITCAHLTVTTTATSTTTPLSYSWSPAPFSGANSATAVFNTPGNYTVTANNSSTGCSNTATLAVNSNTTAPAFTVTPTRTLTCANPTTVLSTTVSGSTGMTFSWTGSGVTGSTADSVTVSQGGVYTVTVTSTVNGCTSTASSTVTSASGLPTAFITTVPANSMLTCVNHTVNLSATATPTSSISYTWSTGANTSTTSTSSAGVVTLTVTNTASSCTATAQYTVASNTTAPQLSVSNATIPCGANSSTVLTASSTNTNATYNWTASGGGSITSGAGSSSPNVTGAGNYNVTITDPANGCTTTSVAVVSQPGINAAFSASPTSGVAPLAVSFTNQSTGASNYIWDFDNGSGSTSTDPSTTYPITGTYTVVLIATSGTCIDTAYAVIVVDPPFSIEIPNVFTPNGDNVNDVFSFKSTGVKELSLLVFNRWGEKLCDVSGAQASWNGNTPSGAKVPDGTYFFMVKATGFDGKEVSKQGTVSLYR